MTDDELERLLGGAFDAQARNAVPDRAVPPAPRFREPRRHRSVTRLVAPLAAAAAVAASVTVVVAVTQTSHDRHPVGQQLAPSTSGSAAPTVTTPTASAASIGVSPTKLASSVPKVALTSVPAAKRVHLTAVDADGQYGVGMPVIVRFSKRITDARSFAAATSVLVGGRPATAAWYFESSPASQNGIEAHLRMQDYWPAHANVHVTVAAQGASAGHGYAFDNDLSIAFTTGARTIAVVNANNDSLTVTTDGKQLGSFPVSLGAANTPTSRGIKVIMQKGLSICMRGPGYAECHIKYTQRLTYDGEYLHAAPWNMNNIRKRINSSNGCTNLLPADAATVYRLLEVGDVVDYPNTDGPPMRAGAGYGDWNVDWSTWVKGGLLATT